MPRVALAARVARRSQREKAKKPGAAAAGVALVPAPELCTRYVDQPLRRRRALLYASSVPVAALAASSWPPRVAASGLACRLLA